MSTDLGRFLDRINRETGKMKQGNREGLGDCMGAGEDGEEPTHQVPLHRRLLQHRRTVWALYEDKIGGGRQPSGHHYRLGVAEH
jgi:hypothetical protein